MSTAQQQADVQVREHFTSSAELYVDRYADSYRTVCNWRLDLLNCHWKRDPGEPIRILDVGSGAGTFADMLLERFPRASVCCVDVASGMLRRGRPDPRKQLVLADARRLPFQPDTQFDLINADALMHHLVSSGGYDNTVESISRFLSDLRSRLRPGGLLLIREIYHEHVIHPEFGSRLVYLVSTRRAPTRVAGLLRDVGLKTANVGVCFLSRKRWDEVIRGAGFQLVAQLDKPWGRWIASYFGFICGDIYLMASAETSPC